MLLVARRTRWLTIDPHFNDAEGEATHYIAISFRTRASARRTNGSAFALAGLILLTGLPIAPCCAAVLPRPGPGPSAAVVALMFLDLDHFKNIINDSLGRWHLADELLIAVSRRMRQQVREQGHRRAHGRR